MAVSWDKVYFAMADLPRPRVEVVSRETDAGAEVDVVISRDNKARTFTGGGQGKSRDQAYGEAMDKVLGDHRTAEWIPRG